VANGVRRKKVREGIDKRVGVRREKMGVTIGGVTRGVCS